MTRLLLILGSGETSPAMVTPHQRLFARLGSDAKAVLLDSPYGFQENADELTERIQEYFSDSVGRQVSAITFRAAPPPDAVSHATEIQHLREASWIFAGPGSPSYALRTWQDSAVPEIIHQRLRDGGVVVFASAAALTLGAFTVPVYEIYKVGESPRWLPGLDVLGRATGLRAAVVPHYNNAEGGTHDTRFCYLGERRLAALETQLPPDAFVLGVDEHTGLLIDLDSGVAEVVGRGQVTVRRGGSEWYVQSGESTTLSEIAERAGVKRESVEVELPTSPAGATLPATAVRAALAAADPATALSVIAELDRQATSESARVEVRALLGAVSEAIGGPVDATELVRPLVELLLALRAAARTDKRWSDSDTIRDGLAGAGVIVRDTPDGTTWEMKK